MPLWDLRWPRLSTLLHARDPAMDVKNKTAIRNAAISSWDDADEFEYSDFSIRFTVASQSVLVSKLKWFEEVVRMHCKVRDISFTAQYLSSPISEEDGEDVAISCIEIFLEE